MKIAAHRLATTLSASLMLLALGSLGLTSTTPACAAADNWKSIDARVEQHVFRVNVSIKVQLGDGQFAQLADLSPRMHYPVFVTSKDDKGFRVVGSGTCFAVHTTTNSGTYFLTNKHVVDFAEGTILECQRFFAAVHAQAERTAGFSSVPDRYKQLLSVVNLAAKKDLSGADRSMYGATVDAIWDTYDQHLSRQADPTRQEFNKQLQAVGFKGTSGYFLHSVGSSAKSPLMARIYKPSGSVNAEAPGGAPTGGGRNKRASNTGIDQDLALLFCPTARLAGLALQSTPPLRGDLVQAIGYPVIKQSGVATPADYEPAFTIGRVKEVVPDLVHFEAPVSKGDSGGPLINEQGNVVGVVTRRALTAHPLVAAGESPLSSDTILPATAPTFAAAISVPAVIKFAPELFGTSKTAPRPAMQPKTTH